MIIALLIPVTMTAQKRTDRDYPVIPIHSQEQQDGRQRDTFPHILPIVLPADIFIPKDRLFGYTPWTSAPVTRPVVFILPTFGFNGSIGFGLYAMQHPDKFFSTLEGRNVINIPRLYVTRQMLLGNTFRIARNFYYLSGIMYGAQMGVFGNNWGMGAREGFIWNPRSSVSIVFWVQDFQSLSVYTPVMFPTPDGSGAAITMPATPEVFSFGVQANFTAGKFIIGIGTSVAPVPFQKRKHSEFRYK